MNKVNSSHFSLLRPILFLHLFFCLEIQSVHASVRDCEVVRYNTIFNIEEGKLIETNSFLIQINARRGEKYTQISIPYSENNRISNLEGWIEDTLGNVIRTLKNAEISDISSISESSMYTDDYVRKFTLKHNIYPYRIHCSYTITSKQYLMVADWDPVLDLDVPTRQASLTVIYPLDYRLNIAENRIGSPTNVTVNHYVHQSWNTSYSGLLHNEIFAPNRQEWIPYVKIVPLSFVYGLPGTTDSWENYGKWQAMLLEGLDHIPDRELTRIQAIIIQCQNKKEVIRELYHYMQDNTRYINVSLGIGGYKPYSAEYVSVNKYGDCKALTNYMKTLLAIAGIQSYYTKVFRDDQPVQLIRKIPGQQFNHVLLTVPLDNDTVWLENTDNTNPFGYLDITDQNREALIVDGENSHIIRLPAITVIEALETGTTEYSLSMNGISSVRMTHTYRGSNFDLFNAILYQLNPEQQNEYLHNLLPRNGAELTSWKLNKTNRDDRQIRLVASYNQTSLVKSAGSEYYFSIHSLDLPDFDSPKERKLPVQIPYPMACNDTLIYHLPAGSVLVKLPENIIRRNKYGIFETYFSQNQEDIIVERKFVLNAGKYEVIEYPELYGFLSQIKTDEKRKIIFYKP